MKILLILSFCGLCASLGLARATSLDQDLLFRLTSGEQAPDAIDWRSTPGFVSGVKAQGKCIAGWAFAITGLIEGQELSHGLTNELVVLSEQSLVDCALKFGCDGGDVIEGLEYLKSKGFLNSEKSYPFEHKVGKCRSTYTDRVKIPIKEVAVLKEGDEDMLKQVVGTYGPVAVSINAMNLNQYRSGVFFDRTCSNDWLDLSHAALVVGYGTDAKEGDFWIVKNSWGSKYGEKGYVRMARNKGNNCGIATRPVVVFFKKPNSTELE